MNPGDAFVAPRGLLEKKPAHGEPCTRCGLCCIATLCPLARTVFGERDGPCPALSFVEGGSTCGLVAEPIKFARVVAMRSGVETASQAALHLIGSALGCDARFNGEPASEAFYEKLHEHDRRTASLTRRAEKVWGVR
jgi:hypothetical protein